MANALLIKLARAYLCAYSVFFVSILFVLVRGWIVNSTAGSSDDKIAVQTPIPPLYQDLRKDRIRLLKLLPGKPGQPLFATLSESSNWRVDYDTYKALSYVWGKPDVTEKHKHSIVLDGHVVSISTNLYEALQHLRKPLHERILYVDALCINQSDDSERAIQVAMLGDVYRSASSVLVWLGPSTSKTALGFEILNFLFGSEDLFTCPPWTGLPAAKIRTALSDVLHSEYFSRMWVVPENALARRLTLQSSAHALSWWAGAETQRAIIRLKFLAISPHWKDLGLGDIDFKPLLDTLEHNMMVFRQRSGRTCRSVTFLDLAYDFRCRKATNPRDMLFALRNLAPNDVKKDMVIDYKKPVDELYADFFESVKGVYEAEMDFVAKDVGAFEKVEIDEEMGYRGGW
jgi:hypothetical protein